MGESDTCRSRHYGLNVGDRVAYPIAGGKINGEVVSLSVMDNNGAFVKKDDDGKVMHCVAEWCEKE